MFTVVKLITGRSHDLPEENICHFNKLQYSIIVYNVFKLANSL